jgi:hypothetical protein
MSAADYEIPLSAYEDEPAARGLRRDREPDVRSRRQSADTRQLWPWKPKRPLGEVLADILIFLQEQVQADELAVANPAPEEKAA